MEHVSPSFSGGLLDHSEAVARTAVNTTISAVTGGLTATIITRIHRKVFSIDLTCMGILSGLVSITGAGPWVAPHAALACGAGGFCLFYLSYWALRHANIDDPVASFSVHGACGAWGLIAAGLFNNPSLSGSTTLYWQQVSCP